MGHFWVYVQLYGIKKGVKCSVSNFLLDARLKLNIQFLHCPQFFCPLNVQQVLHGIPTASFDHDRQRQVEAPNKQQLHAGAYNQLHLLQLLLSQPMEHKLSNQSEFKLYTH